MYIALSRIALRNFGLTFAFAIMALGIGLAYPLDISAQTELNQAYDCGTYGAGSYSQNNCVGATDSTPTPTRIARGLSPDTGANLTCWAAIGALLVAGGLALYGFNRRRQRQGELSH